MEQKMILCDGECDEYYGSCYWEERHMNTTSDGDRLCNDCMFKFMAENEEQSQF